MVASGCYGPASASDLALATGSLATPISRQNDLHHQRPTKAYRASAAAFLAVW